LKVREHSEDLSIDGWIIIKRVFKTWYRTWTGLI